jgi:putative transposase
MYSYEDRIRAIELYLKLGKRQAATRRQLGYPSKSSLLLWCQEYQRRQDLAPSYRRSWEKYSAEQKKVAVDHFMEHGRCVSVTLRALGYPCRKVLGDWIDERHPGVRTQLVGRVRGAPHLEETKRAAVITLCTRQGGAQVIADELAVCRETLYNWKNQLLGKEAPALMRRKSQTESCLPDDRAELEKTIATLKHDIHQLQLEHDLLQKANELLKKGLGVNLTLLSNREKVKLVDALRSTYALSDLLAKVDIARSSYFYHRARCSAPDKYADARRLMASVFEGNHRCYGYRRLQVALRQEKLPLSEKVVRRLMKQERLCAATAKRRRYGTYLGELSPAPDNLINRDFQADHPNQKWLTDITEFQIPAGKVYLSPMIDCFDGMVVSWSLSTRPDAELVNTMLDAAIETVDRSERKPVVHTDRGAHYRWPGWLNRIARAKLTRSMSRKAYSPDNAACEGFFGRLKIELFYARNWQGVTIEHFMETVDAYIRWYNEKRIKMSLGARSPVQYRESLGLTI